MANTDKEISASVSGTIEMHKIVNKYVSEAINLAATFVKDVDKNVSNSISVTSSYKKDTNKKINKSITVTATKVVDDATLTLQYNGNAELGLGAEKGAKFDIEVTGTFSEFTISINGKTLTYTENVINQTITIDNVNATCKNGSVSKMAKLTGDITEFLKLVPGNNVITFNKVGNNVDFKFDFRSQFV